MYKLLSPLLSPYSLITRVFVCGLLLPFFPLANANTAEKIPDFNFTLATFDFTITTNTTAANAKHQQDYLNELFRNHLDICIDQFLPDKLIQ